MMRWRRSVIVYCCAGAALACDRETPASVNRDLGARMAGSWTARLTLDRLPVLAVNRASNNETLIGKFAFVASTDRAAPRATAYGVYDMDFTGLGLPRRRGVPAATLVSLSEDSVEIRLDPTNDETVIVLRGLVQGDSVFGTWTVSVPRVTQGGGRFVMVRRHER
jgi:hypothetical protein